MGLLGRLDARGDLTALFAGTGLVAAVILATERYGTGLAFGAVVALGLFIAVTTCFLVAPYAVVAMAIPLFASIPAMKVLGAPWIGPTKDAVTLSAAMATALYVLQRPGRLALERTDRVVLGAIGGIVVLYVLNVGGLARDSWHGEAWLHGVRLTTEPLILLLAGLLLPHTRRTLDWAARSIVATGCVVAAYGIFQQFVGWAWLEGLGYEYDQQLRAIGPYLRSFGTLDDAFAYAAFLFLALVTAVFWMRGGAVVWACRLLIGVGIAVSFVQTAAVVGFALVALLLVRAGRTAAGVMLLAAALAAAIVLTIAAAPATESKTVRAGPSTYITLNGRTTLWANVFDDKRHIPIGRGVGDVGRASLRAAFGVTEVSGSPGESAEGKISVDSGYLGAVADVGLAGLAMLLLLLGRAGTLAGRATNGSAAAVGWVCLGYLTVLSLDALTRDSFTGFPNAYLGFLLVGLTLGVMRDEAQAHRTAPAR